MDSKEGPRFLLADGLGHDVYPASAAELAAALQTMDAAFRAKGEPRMVVLFAKPEVQDTPRLSIGLGASASVLAFDQSVARGVGSISKGAGVGDTSPVGFAYGNDYAEFFASNAVPTLAAIAAAQEFWRTGRRPTGVDWEHA